MPTDTDRELAGQIAELSRQFSDLRVQLATSVGEITATIEREFGAVRTDLAGFKGKTDTAFKVAITAVCLLVPVAIGLIGTAVSTSWSAGTIAASVKNQGDQIAEIKKMMKPSFFIYKPERGFGEDLEPESEREP